MIRKEGKKCNVWFSVLICGSCVSNLVWFGKKFPFESRYRPNRPKSPLFQAPYAEHNSSPRAKNFKIGLLDKISPNDHQLSGNFNKHKVPYYALITSRFTKKLKSLRLTSWERQITSINKQRFLTPSR